MRIRMNILKKNFILLILIAIISSCSVSKPPIRIGVNSWPPCEIWYIAEKMGYFGHTPVEIIRFTSWTDNMSSLYSGLTDITHSTYFNAIYFSDKGEEAQIILTSDTILGADGLVIKNYLDKGENLRNKKIAVEVDTDEHFFLKKALEKYGLREADVTIIATTSIEAKDKFISGVVDACFTYEPFLSEAATEGDGKVIFSTKDLKGYMIDTLVAKRSTIKKRKRDLISILSAWYKAQEYIKNNAQEAFIIMGKKEGMSPKEFGDFYGSFTFLSPQDNLEIFSSGSFKDKLREMNDFLYLHKAIYEKVNIEEIYNPTIIRRVK
jgi:NitT/TauT family transport system substrate-binding protein